MTVRALIVVDLQNDFCEDGALAVSEGHAVAASVAELLASEHDYHVVVATRDHHIDPGQHFSSTPDFVNSWPRHCVAGTHGAALHPALSSARFEAVFDKGDYHAAYSGFEGSDRLTGTDLASYLRRAGVQTVDVCGLATDYCVDATAMDAVAAGFDTTVLIGLTAAVAPSSLPAMIANWQAAGIRTR